MIAVCVDPAIINLVWPKVSKSVRRAIDRGHNRFEEVERNILNGLSLVWLALDGDDIEGVAVTGLFGDACEIIAASGHNFRSWLHLIDELENYARAEGKTRMRIIGRKGWVKVLPDYKQTSIVLERAL